MTGRQTTTHSVLSTLHALAIHKVMLAPKSRVEFTFLEMDDYAVWDGYQNGINKFRITEEGERANERFEKAGYFGTV